MNYSYLRTVPLPAKAEEISDKGFILNSKTVIQVSPDLEEIGRFLKNKLAREGSFDLSLEFEGSEKKELTKYNRIVLKLDYDLGDKCFKEFASGGVKNFSEGYFIETGEEGLYLSAADKEGIFRGVQTIRQLVPLKSGKVINKERNEVFIPSLKITDFPRFPWRGFMLDVARHFYGLETVKQLIDSLALMKMNVLHLHLCDDQGWRIQIDRYPFLTKKGSFREASYSGGFLGRKSDNRPHSGYYTKDDILEIVEYAAKNFITVVPEIEMPGHCSAALASYPFLGCRGEGYEVAKKPGIKKEIYCAGQDSTYEFLKNVIDEVLEIFPSKWIHLGGDEVPETSWKKCQYCSEKIKQENLKDEKGLRHYFMEQMTQYVRDKGRYPITWNDILWENTSTENVIQYWQRGSKDVKGHIRRGGKVIASNFFNTYLDYNHGVLPLSKIYSYNPVFKDLKGEDADNILGMEAPLWTESAKTIEHVHSYVFPRLVALAENSWTLTERKSFKSFTGRLPFFLERIRLMGISHTDIQESNPAGLKRFLLWKKIYKQSSELPEKIIKPL